MSEKNLLQPKPPDYSDETRYRRLASGAILEIATGKLVGMDASKNPWAITPATAQEMNKKSVRMKRIRGRRGIALGAGYELPDDATIDEINAAAGSGFEAVIAHTLRTYLKSGNLRGMGETFAKLAALMDDDDEPDQDNPHNKIPAQVILAGFLS